MDDNYQHPTERQQFEIVVTEEEFDHITDILEADEGIDSANFFWDSEERGEYIDITCDGEYTYHEMSRIHDQAKACIKDNFRWSDVKPKKP